MQIPHVAKPKNAGFETNSPNIRVWYIDIGFLYHPFLNRFSRRRVKLSSR